MTQFRLRDIIALVALVVCTTVVSIALPKYVPLLGAAERWLSDLRVVLLSDRQPQHPDIVLVVITEDTLAQLPYRSPVDRAFLASVLQRLDNAGVKAIGIDVLIDQPTEAAKDAELKQVLEGMRAPTILAWADESDGLTPTQSAYLAAFSKGIRPGSVTLLTDPYDGAIRWIYPGRMHDGTFIPSFPAALARVLGQSPPEDAEPIRFRTAPDAQTPSFRSFPSNLVPLLPKAWLAGRIVLIGSDLPHTDRHRTTLSAFNDETKATMPGVMIHAHALAQLLDGGKAPTVHPTAEASTVVFAACVALIVGCLDLPIVLHTIVGVALFLALWGAAFVLYNFAGVLTPLVSPSLAFALTLAAGNAYWHGRTRKHASFVRSAFSRFTSPAIVKELIRDPQRLRLGGEKREITCLFTDIAGFTSWAESADPEQALATLNRYLDGMCRIVFDHDGTLNKIVGDALHVLFGAPVLQLDHAERAVRCALALDAFASAYSIDMQRKGVPFGKTRIGVHSGTAVVGNFGGERFFDYTAYGDVVNTTARLESANKYFGTNICISADTAARATGWEYRPIGAVTLVGKTTPIDVLEPVLQGTATYSQLNGYLEAFSLMRHHRPGAQEKLAEIQRECPDDGLVAFHLHRLLAGENGIQFRLSEK